MVFFPNRLLPHSSPSQSAAQISIQLLSWKVKSNPRPFPLLLLLYAWQSPILLIPPPKHLSILFSSTFLALMLAQESACLTWNAAMVSPHAFLAISNPFFTTSQMDFWSQSQDTCWYLATHTPQHTNGFLNTVLYISIHIQPLLASPLRFHSWLWVLLLLLLIFHQ